GVKFSLSGGTVARVHIRTYFKNIRDANKRLKLFSYSMSLELISTQAFERIISNSTKPTEFDKLANKLTICAEIAKARNIKNWDSSFVRSNNFNEANKNLTNVMIELAIPVVYRDLQGEELIRKQNILINLAENDANFGDILEICCRSVGIYATKYPNYEPEFNILLQGIRQSLELNHESDPEKYKENRATLSNHQFERIFQEFPAEIKDEVMQMWLDLAQMRTIQSDGVIIVNATDTGVRLQAIKSIVNEDLSVHLIDLFIIKVKEMETKSAKWGVK
ncbi:MAG: hypothetical protein WCO06_06070, partial [Candidatus Roizmanbacteria bacterium]